MSRKEDAIEFGLPYNIQECSTKLRAIARELKAQIGPLERNNDGLMEESSDIAVFMEGKNFLGSFGSGKSYILSALLNELSNKGFRTVNVYYPSLLKRLKASFNEYNYDEVLDEIMTSDILLIDDIGAENNSSWARDEVLGTILQYRMDNDLTTFFTSNFNINELESVLSETSKGTDEIKARRIIERIKYLTEEQTLISGNKRK